MNPLRFWLIISALWLGAWTSFSQALPDESFVRFRFREPRLTTYRVSPAPQASLHSTAKTQWIQAWPDPGTEPSVELGSRIVLQLSDAAGLDRLLSGHSLEVVRTVAPNLWVIQAPDAWTAASEAQRLAQLPGVRASYPVTRRQGRRDSPYAAKPNDPYFTYQWYLENRDTHGASGGVDLNVRAAWPFSLGNNVLIAVVDDGVELTHPELALRALGAPHFNFNDSTTNGSPSSTYSAHGTAVAGLALAEGNNHRGMRGAAPQAGLASWVIFSQNDMLPSEEQMMDMFQYRSNVVSVQNHSWGNAGLTPMEPGLLEQIGISNAVTWGRGGRGVVMVRSAGNGRNDWQNANDDGYPSSPFAIAVGAVRLDGRVASYSNPGACLLVVAPSGDEAKGFPTLFTTDMLGAKGFNQISFTNDMADYAFNAYGFSGTSASAPQISGLVALILAANPELTYRDVQQVLIHSSRQWDLADPDVATNGAGFRVSHNTGFGVPDAGFAVRLARSWTNRPPLTHLTFTSTHSQAIPDDGLRLLITGDNVPPELADLHCLPGEGPHPDIPTAILPLVYAGLATNSITLNLTNSAAFIQRGISLFSEKIDRAAQAGAGFAIIYNNTNGTELVRMAESAFGPIPAVFINQTDGEALANLLQPDSPVFGQLHLDSATYSFAITNCLLLEHVGVRVATDHTRRGDVRITLLSPQGTRSVLQRLNFDDNPGPADWAYYSTHHFYESSAGTWTVALSDEEKDNTGTAKSVSLILYGVPMTDSDHDGLDDDWERAHFKSLSSGPQDDPDHDGYSNMREQIMGTDPMVDEVPLQLDLSIWNNDLVRLSWPSTTNQSYAIWAGDTTATPLTLMTNLPGRFPETEWFVPYTKIKQQFLRVRKE